MTTIDPSQGTPAPTATPAPAAPAAPAPPTAPPAPTTAATAADPAVDPNWLKPRLERERKAALKAVGFESEAEAKAAADAQRTAADSKKTAEQRAADLQTLAATEKARADSLLAVATEHAARMMVGLTPEQQSAVKAVAGDDPAKQLSTIGALAPTWAKQPGAAPTDKPATTAPPATAPNGTTPAPTDARAVYESQRSQNPFAAALFGVANPQVYNPKQ